MDFVEPMKERMMANVRQFQIFTQQFVDLVKKPSSQNDDDDDGYDGCLINLCQ